jgi:tetratricopeptide (TPR) repeat protein
VIVKNIETENSIADGIAFDYLKKSLAIKQKIGDKKGEGIAFNNISQIFRAKRDYNTALDYLKRSLAIKQEIGDVAGLCLTQFNIGHIHRQNKEVMEAIQLWITVYDVARKINLSTTLTDLEKLANHLGLPDGLLGWEMPIQQIAEHIDNRKIST